MPDVCQPMTEVAEAEEPSESVGFLDRTHLIWQPMKPDLDQRRLEISRQRRCSQARVGFAVAFTLAAALLAFAALPAREDRGHAPELRARSPARLDVVSFDAPLENTSEVYLPVRRELLDVICQAEPVYDFWVAAYTQHSFHFGDPALGEVRGDLQFYAFPSPVEGTLPVFSFLNAKTQERTYHMGKAAPGEDKEKVIFYAYPLSSNMSSSMLVSSFWNSRFTDHTLHLWGPWKDEVSTGPQFYAYSQDAMRKAGCASDSLLMPVVGVNLGGWLLAEDWMWSAEMESKGIFDEWSLIRSYGGPDDLKAQLLMKSHWETFVTAPDLDKLKVFGVTHVRIPIGYWLVDYDKEDGFIDGGEEYLQRVLMWLKPRGMKALLDLHALPGGQALYQSFTGRKTFIAEFFMSQKHFERGKRAMRRLAHLILSYEKDWRTSGVVWGMELVNEPDWRYWDTSPGIRELYEEMVPSLRKMLPADRYYLFLNFQEYPRRETSTRWLAKMLKEDPDTYENVVYDFHQYHSFGDDNQESGSWHADEDSCKTCCRDPLLLEPLVKAKLKMAACEYSLTTGYAGSAGFFKDFLHNQLSLWRSTPGMVGSFFWNHRILPAPMGRYREFSLLDLFEDGTLAPAKSLALVPRCPNSDLSMCPVYDEDNVAWNSDCWWRHSRSELKYSDLKKKK